MNISNIDSHYKRFNSYFQSFSRQYSQDSRNYEHLHLKWIHSLNVAANAELILSSLDFPDYLIRATQLAALYHDVARFEQYKQYCTFKDAKSKNHGAWGSKILGKESFLSDEDKYTVNLVRAAVSMHNRAEIPSNLSDNYKLVTEVVRDADKIDILRVLSAYMHPTGPRSEVVTADLADLPNQWTNKIYEDFMNKRSAKYRDMRFLNDFRLLLCSWLFGFNFFASIAIVADYNHLPKIMEGLPDNDSMNRVRAIVFQILAKAVS